MKIFAVTGHPILFSRSPALFNSIFDKKEIDAKYTRLAANTAKEAVDLFKELDLSGMSVTAPFKTEIIKHLDKVNNLAQEIGSVNTVVNENGKLVGYNTDYNGIIDTLKEIENKKIIVLGAGGAAKAVIYSVLEKGAQVSVFNRTIENATELSQKFKIKVITQENLEKNVGESDIIINTVPSGIKLIEDNWINSKHIIFDAIYHKSVYKEISESKNIKFYSGEDWLINQGIAAFKLFFKDEEIAIEDISLSPLKTSEKIIFTGFMGSGKSCVSNTISNQLSCNFFCTDTIVSNKENLSINELFDKYGESYFRKAEKDVLKMLATMNGKAVISSGGGVVLDAENRDIIKENYLSIWLYASPESIMKRAKPDNRPLLKNNFNLDFISNLMKERKAFYAQSCDIIINTNDKEITEIIDILTSELDSL